MPGQPQASRVYSHPETYELGKGQSTGYPDWGFAKCLRPGTHFRFYVVSRDGKAFPALIRLGKFAAKAELRSKPAGRVERRRGACTADVLLAWDDLSPKPSVFDLMANALPTRLVGRAHFSDVPHLRGHFADGVAVVLPLTAGYLAGASKKAFKCPECQAALKFLETALCDCW